MRRWIDLNPTIRYIKFQSKDSSKNRWMDYWDSDGVVANKVNGLVTLLKNVKAKVT